MNILVIGGTGYMGKIMVERLLDRGDRVTVFSRGTIRPDWWSRVSHIPGDRNDAADFNAKLKALSFDAVVDTQAYRWEDVQSAVETLRGNVGRYLLVSTSSVYLDGKVDFFRHCPYDESAVEWSTLEYTYPEGEDPYAVGKRHCEKWLLAYCNQLGGGIPYTIIRIPAVMGPEDPTGRMWWWVQRALDGGPVVVADGMRGAFRTLYSADAAANFIRTLDAPDTIGGVYFIGMPEILTPERWAELIWQAAGHRPQVVYVSQAVIGKSEGLAGYAAPLTRPASNIHDRSRARRDIGIITTPVEEWVASTVAWYRDHYRGPDSDGYEHRNREVELARRWEERMRRLVAEF